MKIFFLFFIFLFFGNLNWNSAHVMLDKQKFPLLLHIFVSLFMGKTVKEDTTWFRKMMFSFKCCGRISEMIFWINGYWQRTPTPPEEWKFHSLIMSLSPLVHTPMWKQFLLPLGHWARWKLEIFRRQWGRKLHSTEHFLATVSKLFAYCKSSPAINIAVTMAEEIFLFLKFSSSIITNTRIVSYQIFIENFFRIFP